MALLTENPLVTEKINTLGDRRSVVVAGPGSSTTVPGLIVSEIVQALAKSTRVTRIEVDVNTDLLAGLFRAPSLAAAHEPSEYGSVRRHRAPANARQRTQYFRDLIGPDVRMVIAYAWPGIDNSWIKQFIHAGRTAGALTVVTCASLPQPRHDRAVMLAGTFAYTDVIFVGDDLQARELSRVYGRSGPVVETHPALSLEGRSGRPSKRQITAFLPKDGLASLTTLLAAFDAIPEAWVDEYCLRVVMRFDDQSVPAVVEGSYHKNHVELIGDNISSLDLKRMFASSSALGIASPAVDSRVFSAAMDSGIGTVVFLNAQRPEVGRGYVGGLLADTRRPASLHVALHHALRLEDLHFPNPGEWKQLARRLGSLSETPVEVDAAEPVATDF